MRAICDQDGDQHEGHHARATVEAAQDGEAGAQPATAAAGQRAQACPEQDRDRDAQGRNPPLEAERADEGEGRQCGEDGLGGEDRDLGPEQRRNARAPGRARAPQDGDAGRDGELPVGDRRHRPDARRAVEATAADGRPGGAHRHVPRLRAREQREQLEGGGNTQQPQRGRVQGGGEAVALAVQRRHEGANHRERDEDRQCRAHAGPARQTLRGEHGGPFGSTATEDNMTLKTGKLCLAFTPAFFMPCPNAVSHLDIPHPPRPGSAVHRGRPRRAPARHRRSGRDHRARRAPDRRRARRRRLPHARAPRAAQPLHAAPTAAAARSGGPRSEGRRPARGAHERAAIAGITSLP